VDQTPVVCERLRLDRLAGIHVSGTAIVSPAIVLFRGLVDGLDVALGEVLGGLRSSRFGCLPGIGSRRARNVVSTLLYLARGDLAAAYRPVPRNLRVLVLRPLSHQYLASYDEPGMAPQKTYVFAS
jgi:hypothetical protein